MKKFAGPAGPVFLGAPRIYENTKSEETTILKILGYNVGLIGSGMTRPE